MADRVATVVSRICRPRPVASGESVSLLIHNASGDVGTSAWSLEAAPDCADSALGTDGGVDGVALKLDTPLSAGEWVEVSYEASVAD
ncbi:MAG: hypothetical protein ACI9WU_005226 [Myxococcota bacterium]